MMNPKKIIAIGFVLVLFGFLAPLLMVLKVIKTTYVLSFLAHGASVAGLILGIIGSAMYSRLGRR
jgi:hypothetical protein